MALIYNILSALGVLAQCSRLAKRPTIGFGLIAAMQFGAGSTVLAMVIYAITGSHWLVIQLASWTIFLHVPLFLLGEAYLFRLKNRLIALGCILMVLLITGVAAYAFLIEPYNLEARRHSLSSTKITKSLKIGVIADLQSDNPGPYEERALRLLMDEEPDLILFPGDYVQHRDPHEYDTLQTRLNTLLKKLEITAPLGVYAIEGDQEIKHHARWTGAFTGTEIVTLSSTITQDVGEIALTALSFDDSVKLRSPVVPSEKFHIVFGHRPDFSLDEPDADLLIAGHTHGGQVQLPLIGPLVTASRVPRA